MDEPSLLHKVVTVMAIVLGLLCASVSSAQLASPIRNGRESFWFALGAAGVIAFGVGAFVAVSG